jgi:hypothetical protein
MGNRKVLNIKELVTHNGSNQDVFFQNKFKSNILREIKNENSKTYLMKTAVSDNPKNNKSFSI